MYLRFASRHFAADSHLAEGLFGAAYELLYCDGLPQWAWCELRRTLDWFNAELPKPDRFVRRRGPRKQGICWFTTSASDYLRETRYLGWLCTEFGRPIFELCTNQPGLIVYQDASQIVAVPGRETPRLRTR